MCKKSRAEIFPEVVGSSSRLLSHDIGRLPESASMESSGRENHTFRLTNKRFYYNYLALIK